VYLVAGDFFADVFFVFRAIFFSSVVHIDQAKTRTIGRSEQQRISPEWVLAYANSSFRLTQRKTDQITHSANFIGAPVRRLT
jgi:hypothetical protein